MISYTNHALNCLLRAISLYLNYKTILIIVFFIFRSKVSFTQVKTALQIKTLDGLIFSQYGELSERGTDHCLSLRGEGRKKYDEKNGVLNDI